MKRLACAAALVWLVAAPAWAAMDAQEFVIKAGIGGMFEVQSSRVALDRIPPGDPLHGFAERMLDDHGKIDTALRNAAARTDLNLPSSLDRLRTDRMDALNQAKGDDFRQRYVEFQELAHEEAVRVFEEYAKVGENPRLTGFAEDTLPTLRAHKREIDAFAAR